MCYSQVKYSYTWSCGCETSSLETDLFDCKDQKCKSSMRHHKHDKCDCIAKELGTKIYNITVSRKCPTCDPTI